ncbi:leucine--tRNA ligase [Patescibacteria group bacterium]|nr:leucine--tRNA ligase [Patescibacteria group bacterium]
MQRYNFEKIEKKWQAVWDKLNIYKAEDFNTDKPKQYILVEFPYTSGDGLHVGHVRGYTALDILARKKRMQGINVLYPMGWDAFGLPTENYAIKSKIHPMEITAANVKLFKRQLKSLGMSFDWSREINTTSPAYYKWTQWIFSKLFINKLAYQDKIPINWCSKCKIGLANEEVIAGKCERCGSITVKKEKKQWMLKITKYADRLIKDLDGVNYLDKIKSQQINWIGKSKGTQAIFKIDKQNIDIEVFTTRIDTIFGVTSLVLAPEHKIIGKLKSQIKNWDQVANYIKQASKKSDLERTDLNKTKTGVILKGVFAINPVSQKKVPIWMADYVISSYGGGAVMVVPAHDKRDYVFAKKHNMEIIEVIKGGDVFKQAYTDYGNLINSGEFDKLTSVQAIKQITKWLAKNKKGGPIINYKLRDWVFSRQHYWGEPIPIIHCEKCKAVLVDERDLPVILPKVKEYEPTETGESPLAKIKEWVNVKCPKCNGPGKRETDTMPNWAGSSWYFLRYIDPNNDSQLADFKKLKYWLPVDIYNGGMEHTTLHLLYSRFWHKFLYDIGVVPCQEPYQARISHGMVLGEGGVKMSKSLGNVINPDNIIKNHGADALRVYEMFMGPFDQAIAWDSKTIDGIDRFLMKIIKLTQSNLEDSQINSDEQVIKNLEQIKHQTIKKVSQDIEDLKFNTAIACLMEYVNNLLEYNKQDNVCGSKDMIDSIKILILLMSVFAPHLSEDLWHKINSDISDIDSIFQEQWPKHDLELVKSKQIDLIIQINGKFRHIIKVDAGLSKQKAGKLAKQEAKIQKYLKNKQASKIIFVPDKIINFVL